MDLTSSVLESEELNHVLHALDQIPGVVPDTPEYALLVAKVALQFACGGRVIAYRLKSGWQDGNFYAKYEIIDDQGGTSDDVRARLAARSDVQPGDVSVDYVDPLDAEQDDAYLLADTLETT